MRREALLTLMRGVAAPAPAAVTAAMAVDPGTPRTVGHLVPGRGPRGAAAVQARMQMQVHQVRLQVKSQVMCHQSHLLLHQKGMMTRVLAARVTVMFLGLGLDMEDL